MIRSLIWVFLSSASLYASEFEMLMGKESPDWIYVSKEEDVAVLKRFEKIYNKNRGFQFQEAGIDRIPKVIHCVWLGPEELPKENLKTWAVHHPDWQINLWTDRFIDVDQVNVKLKDVKNFSFLSSNERFSSAQSVEEMEGILRFEILYKEGGLLVDLRSRCLKPFDGLHKGYNFFCALKAPHPPVSGRNISSMQAVVGASPFHPVIGRCIRQPSTSFLEALLAHLEEDQNRDIVFPAEYFSSEKGYATSGEMGMPRHVARTMASKQESIGWLGKGALSLNLVALTGAWVYFARKRKKRGGE